jgi:GDP-4-dehydro-6-deoxy-D-mannose reductase
LITGVAGFCGAHLAGRLRREGAVHLTGVDRAARPAQCPVDEYYVADLDNEQEVAGIVERCHPAMIFHLAGLAPGASLALAATSTLELYRVNVMATLRLLEAVRLHAPNSKVLLVGSAAEYGTVTESNLPVTEEHPCRPTTAYGISKHAATLIGQDYARRLNMSIVIARPFNIIGPGVPRSLVLGALLQRAKEALSGTGAAVVKVGNLGSERDFIAVEDVVEAYWRMLQGDFRGEIFNLCSGEPCSIRKLGRVLLSNSSRPVRIEVDPALADRASIFPFYGSNAKARRAFGFSPTVSLEESLSAAWRWEIEREGQR